MNKNALSTNQGSELDFSLAELTCNPQLWAHPLDDALVQILETALTALHAQFASLWQYDAEPAQLMVRDFRASRDYRDTNAPSPSDQAPRERQHMPEYFDALTSERYIAADSLRTDIRTAALNKVYFEPQTITAALHIPLRLRGELWGVLCLECKGAARTWTLDEINFASAIAGLIGQLLLQEMLTHVEDTYFSLARYASIGILRTDVHQRVIYSNECLEEITGYSWDVWSSESLLSTVHPDDIESVRQQMRAVVAAKSGNLIYRMIRPDGSELYVMSHVMLEFERIGNQRRFNGMLAILMDVTQHAHAERVLQKLTVKQQAILQGVARVIFATDARGAINTFNRAAETLLGYRAEEVIGRDVATLLHDRAELEQQARALGIESAGSIAPDFEILATIARSKASVETEWNYRCQDGSQIPVALSMTALCDDRENIIGYVGIAKDLREHRRIEALTQSRDRLIQHLLRGLGAKIGVAFFDTLAIELRTALGHCTVQGIELLPGPAPKGHTLMLTSEVPHNIDIPLIGTPSLAIIESGRARHWPNAQADFPDIEYLRNGKDFMGVPLKASDGSIMGALVIFSYTAFEDAEFVMQLLQIFSLRAANELERLRSERAMLARNKNQQWILKHSAVLHERNSVHAVGQITARALQAHSSSPLVSVAMRCPDGYRMLAHSGSKTRPQDFERVFPFEELHEKLAKADNHLLISSDLDTVLASTPDVLKYMRLRNTQAVVFIGLFDADSEVGLITLEYQDPAILDTVDIKSLLIFTRSVGLALSKAIQQEQLEYQATHDNLTGLLNRSVLHRDFSRWQPSGVQSALLLLDLNRFKEVNDTLGHHIGDHLLLQVGARLQAQLAPFDSSLYRLGGDEFAIFARGVGSATAVVLANDLLAALNQPFTLDQVNLEIGGSIGIALYPEHGRDSHALLRSADVAMYKAKHGGLGATLYHRDLDQNSTERLEMIAEFRQGILDRELVLHYQPKVSLATGEMVGFEALARWQHPRLGLLPPQRFLPLIEMSDTIHELTHELLEQTCAQLQQWCEAGHHHSLSLNLSARNLINDRVAIQIKNLFEIYPLARNYLDLEITETALIHEPERALLMMRRIAALGVSFSIDDFGTGYSSLAYLRKMPLSTLKIDRTFIVNMLDNPQDKVIVESTIALAHNLGLTVVAEGVETEEALKFLREKGCDQVQGYLLGSPVPVSQLAIRIDGHAASA